MNVPMMVIVQICRVAHDAGCRLCWITAQNSNQTTIRAESVGIESWEENSLLAIESKQTATSLCVPTEGMMSLAKLSIMIISISGFPFSELLHSGAGRYSGRLNLPFEQRAC